MSSIAPAVTLRNVELAVVASPGVFLMSLKTESRTVIVTTLDRAVDLDPSSLTINDWLLLRLSEVTVNVEGSTVSLNVSISCIGSIMSTSSNPIKDGGLVSGMKLSGPIALVLDIPCSKLSFTSLVELSLIERNTVVLDTAREGVAFMRLSVASGIVIGTRSSSPVTPTVPPVRLTLSAGEDRLLRRTIADKSSSSVSILSLNVSVIIPVFIFSV